MEKNIKKIKEHFSFLPYQSGWIRDKSQVKICEKSRRIGLTWAQAADDVLLAASKNGTDVLYISFNQAMTREYIETCAEWAKTIGVMASAISERVFRTTSEREIKSFRIDFESGNKILALPSRPLSLRGKQGRVVIDEAAFVENLSELLKAALALLMWGGQVVIISTHNGIDNPFNKLVQDVLSGEIPYSLHSITLNTALEQGLYNKICTVKGFTYSKKKEECWKEELIHFYGEGADEELFCMPKRSGGVYLKSELIEACMLLENKVVRYLPPNMDGKDFVDIEKNVADKIIESWLQNEIMPILENLHKSKHYVGVDFGRSGDLSVFWVLAESDSQKLVSELVLELSNTPFRTQEYILAYIVQHLPLFSGISLDARGNGQALAEFSRQSFGKELVNEVMLSENWYRENMPKLKSSLEDKTLILPKDFEIKNDLRALKIIRGIARVPESRSKGQMGSRHCDAAVALVLALNAQSLLSTKEEWEYVSTENYHETQLSDWRQMF